MDCSDHGISPCRWPVFIRRYGPPGSAAHFVRGCRLDFLLAGAIFRNNVAENAHNIGHSLFACRVDQLPGLKAELSKAGGFVR